MVPALARPYSSSGYKMIHEIEIENFRCFKRLNIFNCARINVIVGDNGAGKTSLLEALFSSVGEFYGACS